MTIARLPRFSLARWLPLALALAACVPDSKSLSGGDDDAGGNDDGTNATTGGPDDLSASGPSTLSSGAASSSGTTGNDPCDGAGCVPCPNGCTNNDACVDGVLMCSCECSDTGSSSGGGLCALQAEAEAVANGSKTPPLDCGTATLQDSLETWEAVHACIADSAAQQAGFVGLLERIELDAADNRAFVGVVGRSYGLAQLDQYFGKGGGSGQEPVSLMTCEGLTQIPDCVVGVGIACLQCLNPGASALVCGQ